MIAGDLAHVGLQLLLKVNDNPTLNDIILEGRGELSGLQDKHTRAEPWKETKAEIQRQREEKSEGHRELLA
jgi:hypothetical protein